MKYLVALTVVLKITFVHMAIIDIHPNGLADLLRSRIGHQSHFRLRPNDENKKHDLQIPTTSTESFTSADQQNTTSNMGEQDHSVNKSVDIEETPTHLVKRDAQFRVDDVYQFLMKLRSLFKHRDYDQHLLAKRDDSLEESVDIEETISQIVRRDAHIRVDDVYQFLLKLKGLFKHRDYDQHLLAKRDDSLEESVDIEETIGQIVKRDAHIRVDDVYQFLLKLKGLFKHRDYDQHLLAKRDDSLEESVDIEETISQIVKRDAQFRVDDVYQFLMKLRSLFKHRDYDQHLLAKRDDSLEESVDIEETISQIVKRDAHFRIEDVYQLFLKFRNNFKHHEYDQHLIGKRDDSLEESVDVEDAINGLDIILNNL